MVVFPNCKINLGLNVISRRDDGFHDLQTVFYPISWCDALEVIINTNENTTAFGFTSSGLPISGDQSTNLVYRAYEKIRSIKNLPSLSVHLHKHIPMGAGLGGGSADAAFFIKQINQQLQLGLSLPEQLGIAASLGSDCAFFILNQSAYGTGRGEILEPFSVDLSKYYLLLIHPGIHCSTAEAFAGLNPKQASINIKDVLKMQVSDWKKHLSNDFEVTIFHRYPQIEQIKKSLYAQGALYASMSGSGSAVFGIFENRPELKFAENYSYYLQKPASKIL